MNVDGEELDVEFGDEKDEEEILVVEFDETDKTVVRAVTEFANKEGLEKYSDQGGSFDINGEGNILSVNMGDALNVILKMGRSAIKEGE